MSVYETEAEQLEAIKKWLKDNGASIVVGLTIGFGGLFGWRAWQDHNDYLAESASVEYQQIMSLLQRNDVETASNRTNELLTVQAESPYAAMAAMAMARARVNAGKLPAAEHHLRWVTTHASGPELRQLARLRLARLLLAQQQPDQALALMSEQPDTGYQDSYQELRGDILLSKGDNEGARRAYLIALASMDPQVAAQSWLQMKLDELGTLGRDQAIHP